MSKTATERTEPAAIESGGGSALGLFTDLYQLTMAQGYWQAGLAERRAVFQLFFRRAPFGGQAAIACGLATAVEVMERFRFSADDIRYLAGLVGADGQPLFSEPFLEWLAPLQWSGDLAAVPEGTCVFPREPILRVTARLIEAQLLETALLNVVNFQTLVATKAARVRLAAGSTGVLEFGLRRAQGFDGGLSASRAAYVGGCDATSNVLAGERFGIPVRGTHAHSWVMCFAEEIEAFRAYASAMPGNVVLLVDTYDTRQGILTAIQVGRELQARGGQLLGIRLDSGDLDVLSRVARGLLDSAGFQDTQIVVSGDLDEYRIRDLRQRGAPIDVWGVGTRLVTAFEEPALGGVFKMGAIEDDAGALQPRLKVSDNQQKTSDPGALQVRRFWERGQWRGDVVYDEADGTPVWTEDGTPDDGLSRDLLEPIVEVGQRDRELPSAEDARRRAKAARDEFSRWLWPPEELPPANVTLAPELSRRRSAMIAELQGSNE